MRDTIRVGMADMKVCQAPNVLTTLGLGSCVGVVIYDSLTKVGGMVHAMLPDSTKFARNDNKAKYANSGIETLIDEMVKQGASKTRMVAKIAGGAQMFAFTSNNEMLRIGERNVESAIKILSENHIKIIAQDTGLNYGRTIEFDLDNGQLTVKSVGKPDKTI